MSDFRLVIISYTCNLIQNMLLSFTGPPMTKVLVTTGADIGSKKIEIMDLKHPTNVCQPSFLADYPIDRVQEASGGLLTNNNALICGGFDNTDMERLDDCFSINHNGIKNPAKLSQPRSYAASVVWNSTTLWMTGGWLDGSGRTKSTEFVQLTGTTPGPDLPLEVAFHCLVSLNDTHVLLIGGKDGTFSKATFFFNTDHKTWTNGPSLILGRNYHSCALFKSPQHGHTDTVIVTGGYNGGHLASTEFLNLDRNSWESGKGQLNSSQFAILTACTTIPDRKVDFYWGPRISQGELLFSFCS
jgi:hypothetical protein